MATTKYTFKKTLSIVIRRLISMSGEFLIANTMGLYERENEKEKLKVPGPIQHDISIYVCTKTR